MFGVGILFAFVTVFSFSSTAFGEQATGSSPGSRLRIAQARAGRPSTFRPNKRTTASRKPASEYAIRADQELPRSRGKEWTLQLGLLGGYANANTNNAFDQAQRDTAGFGRNVYIGGIADFRVKRFAGAEVEGFYNISPSRDIVVRDRVLGTSGTESKSLQQYGGMAHLKGQVPVLAGNVRIEPTAGVGYGTVGLRSASVDAAQTERERNTQLWGFYGVVGVEVEPVRRFVLMADYARSFSATGSNVTTASNTLSTTSTEFSSARFERWRGGAYYRFTDLFMAGGQYIGRRLTFAAPGDSVSSQETLNQFLGFVMVGF